MPDPEFEIVAVPAQRVVTPGAHVTYALRPLSPNSPALSSIGTVWVAMNDPKSVSWYRPERVPGPVGETQWEDASWDFEGHHTIICAVTANGNTRNYTYEQYVASLASVIATGPRLPLSKEDPDMVLDGTARMVHILEQLAVQSPPATAELANKHHDDVARLVDYRDHLATRLHSTAQTQLFVVQAEHLESATQRRTVLRVFAAKAGDGWIVVDWTNPTVRAMTGEYAGRGATDRDALKAAFDEWDSDNRYPDGGITYRVENVPGIGTLQSSFDTDGAAFWDSVSAFFTYVGLGAAIVAGAVTLFAPVPGSQIVSAAIWTSIFSSTAAATINIGTRYEEGFSDWKSNAFDVLSIVGNLFGAAGLVWVRGAEITVQTTHGLVKAVIVGQVAADGVQGVLLTVDSANQIDQIRGDASLTPKQKADKIIEILRGLAVAGTLLYINVKGTKADLEHLSTAHPGGTSPSEKLSSLSDPNGAADLTAPPTSGGHTDQGTHQTKVQVDQETATPQVGGRPHLVDDRPLEQKLRDLIGNEHFDEHLASVPGLRAAHPEISALTDEEIVAIRSYCANERKSEFGNLKDYERINLALRNGDTEQTAILQPLIDTLKSGAQKMPPHSGTVFRTLQKVEPDVIKAQFQVGQQWEAPAFTSTSYGKRMTEGQVTMIIGNTRSGHVIQSLSPFASQEREVLFLPGTKFMVTKVQALGPFHFLVFMEE